MEFGLTKILEEDNEFDLPVGNYLAVLSHSGSRGMGAEIARYYTRLAMDKCPLPSEAKHLAWLDLDTAPPGGNPRVRYAYTGVAGSWAGWDQPGSAAGNIRDSDVFCS